LGHNAWVASLIKAIKFKMLKVTIKVHAEIAPQALDPTSEAGKGRQSTLANI